MAATREWEVGGSRFSENRPGSILETKILAGGQKEVSGVAIPAPSNHLFSPGRKRLARGTNGPQNGSKSVLFTSLYARFTGMDPAFHGGGARSTVRSRGDTGAIRRIRTPTIIVRGAIRNCLPRQ
jgi:hypothetical protein